MQNANNILATNQPKNFKQWRRQLVGTWARASPLAFDKFFSLGTLSGLVWYS